MRAFVLDNSASMRWLFGDAHLQLAENVLERLLSGEIAHVPVLWLYEALAVVAKSRRTAGLSIEDAEGFFEDLRSLEIVVDHEGAAQVLFDVRRVADEYGLTRYDAAYLELAIRKGLTLATLDDELRRAAAAAGVELIHSESVTQSG